VRSARRNCSVSIPVFFGTLALKDAAPAAGEHPLVVISHGIFGNWINQVWLAGALAQQGYIVASPNHPGTTSKDRTQPAASELWLRPLDIRRVIDAVIAQPKRFGAVAHHQIAVVGHSLGGWTALEVGGARFDPQRFTEDCKSYPAIAPCKAYQQIEAGRTEQAKQRLAEDLSDKRVAAIVSLDLGFSRGFTDESLAALQRPMLVIAAGVPSPELPAATGVCGPGQAPAAEYFALRGNQRRHPLHFPAPVQAGRGGAD